MDKTDAGPMTRLLLRLRLWWVREQIRACSNDGIIGDASPCPAELRELEARLVERLSR